MGLPYLVFSSAFYILIQLSTGQLLPREELRAETSCLPDVNITCGNSELIAIQSLYYLYDPACANTCCNYNSSHSNVSADPMDVQDLLRHCSGQRICNRKFTGMRDFGSAGLHNPSYIMIQFFCVPDSRVLTVCSDEELMSEGPPLYLTSKNYPSVTTGDSTCSCSVEVNSCTSNIQLYLFDVDLYLNTDTCEQSLEFLNSTDGLLEKISCESYYINTITSVHLKSHYIKIDFIDESTQNQEGYFFLGLGATEANVSISISCPAKQESTCIDCDDQGSVTNGNIRLHEVNNTGNGALADVVCNSGYETNETYVRCLDTGHWENATCIPKDCGEVPVIADGKFVLEDSDNTTYGALAVVQCSQGFESESNIISCLDSGQWSTVACTPKECGSTARLDHGTVTVESDPAIVGAVARVACDTGYNASVTSIRCLHSGEWEDVVCSIKDCGNLPDIEYGRLDLLDNNSSTTYNSKASVTCQKGYTTQKQVVTCEETGRWEDSTCEPEKTTKDESNTSVIAVSVLVPILVVALLIVAFYVIWRYRQRLWTRGSSKGHDRVSFKNEEVLPEDQECQNLHTSYINEGALLNDQNCQASDVPYKNEESLQEGQESNASYENVEMLPDKQQNQVPHVAVKMDEVPQDNQVQEPNVVQTDEAVPDKEQDQDPNINVKTNVVLSDKQRGQEPNVDVQTDEAVQDKEQDQDPNINVVLPDKEQGQEPNVDVQTDEALPDKGQDQYPNSKVVLSDKGQGQEPNVDVKTEEAPSDKQQSQDLSGSHKND